MTISPEQRIAGVLAPLFAIRTENDLGVGDLDGLRQFIDWSASVGFKLVQLLPINETGPDNSPYNAISAMAIEATTLHLAPGSPGDLTSEDFESVIASANLKKLRTGAVKYETVKRLKRALLENAFAKFLHRQPNDAATRRFVDFCAEESAWLGDYTLFRVLMEENGSEMWDTWPAEYATIQAAMNWLRAQPLAKRAALEERRRFHCYVQWVAYDQWSAVKDYADERGIALMGDIPFGVSYYSADVFARPDQFALDCSGGAPPEPYFKDDLFTQKWGQNWGIPLYRWDVMRGNNFTWWRQRVRGVKRIFHVFRIDHVLGFYRIYSFPWRPQRNGEILPLSWEEARGRNGGRIPQFSPRNDESWDSRQANRHEGEEYLRMVLDESGETRVVGEDLGTVPDYVRPSLTSLGIAGFKIPQWENYHGRTTPGREYQRLSVATFATHDHKPLRAMWEEAFEKESSTRDQSRDELRKVAEFAGIAAPDESQDYAKDFFPAIMRALFTSEAWMAILMITDLLCRKDRFNVPGTAANSNWSRRMTHTVSHLASSPAVKRQMAKLRNLMQETGRA